MSFRGRGGLCKGRGFLKLIKGEQDPCTLELMKGNPLQPSGAQKRDRSPSGAYKREGVTDNPLELIKVLQARFGANTPRLELIKWDRPLFF